MVPSLRAKLSPRTIDAYRLAVDPLVDHLGTHSKLVVDRITADAVRGSGLTSSDTAILQPVIATGILLGVDDVDLELQVADPDRMREMKPLGTIDLAQLP